MKNIYIIKKYWDNFHKSDTLTKKESNFAKFFLEYLKKKKINHIIDVETGNFRDSFFFSKIKLKDKIDNPILLRLIICK